MPSFVVLTLGNPFGGGDTLITLGDQLPSSWLSFDRVSGQFAGLHLSLQPETPVALTRPAEASLRGDPLFDLNPCREHPDIVIRRDLRVAHHDCVLQIEIAATAPSLACEVTEAMTLLLDVDLRLIGLVVSGLDHDQRAVLDRVLPGGRPP